MAQQAVGLFGLKVSPGEEVQLESMEDVRITNISLGENVKNGVRTVVRVHHRPVPSYDDSDDSDDEDDEELDDEELDVEEDEGEEEAEDAKADAEEEDGDDEDVDDEDEEEEQTFVVCTLVAGQREQVTVDLHFSVDDDVRFSVTGENAVEIMGNYLSPGRFDDDPDFDELIDSEDDEEIDSDELEMLEGASSDEEDEEIDDDDILVELDSDEDDEEDDRIHEIEIELPNAKSNGKKRSAAEADMSIDNESEDSTDITKLTKNQKKKLEKRLRAEGETSTASIGKEKVAVAKKEADKPAKVATKETLKKDDKPVSKKVTLPSGVIVEDMKVGSGPQAKNGNRLGMRYVGRLANGKMFDSNTKGKPFTFKLGKGEVIGGWDQGLRGMQVGGERRLVIPPKQAYGARGAPPDIPGNATLTFDVKLVEIK